MSCPQDPLNAEWTACYADQPTPWPALAGQYPRLDDLVSPTISDQALEILIRHAQDGDDIATRSVVQSQLGAIVGLTRRLAHHFGGDPFEAFAEVTSLFLHAMHKYPRRPARRVSARLQLDTLQRATLRSPRRVTEVALGEEVISRLLHDQQAEACHDLTGPTMTDRETMLQLLRMLLDDDVLRATDVDLLTELYSPADGDVSAAVRRAAETRGLHRETLWRRAQRARARAAAHISATAGDERYACLLTDLAS